MEPRWGHERHRVRRSTRRCSSANVHLDFVILYLFNLIQHDLYQQQLGTLNEMKTYTRQEEASSL